MGIIKKYVSVEEALQKLKKYCAYQERCHQEVKSKLFDYRIYGDDQDEIITELIKDDYLNETRFSQFYVRGKFRIKKWSKVKIMQELKRRNISDYNIRKAMDQIDEHIYSDNIVELIKKKKRSLKEEPNTLLGKKKITNYMLSKGYSYSEISDFL